VDPRKIDRLLAARGNARLSVIVESPVGWERWSQAASRAGREMPVLLEVDVGMGRTGVRPEDAVEAARAVHEAPGLELRGILTHAGHGYGASSYEERAEIGRLEGETLVKVAEAIRAAGLPCDEVSVGSTPTAEFAAAVPGVTEVRPGNSVFHDGIQVDLGVVDADRCALTVLATVVARPAPDRIVLDCGSKTLSSDVGRAGAAGGFGRVWGREDLRLVRLSEEHGILPIDPAETFAVGDRLRIVPNHACATTNLHERFVVVDGERVVEEWSIAARGRID
jgi:D-serine deaminase-like pyridoxal phosphate-dependent protein